LEAFTFHESDPGETKTFDFESSLFHHPAHLSLQRAEGWKWYYTLHTKRANIVASLYLNINGEVANSAVRSPFGTVECAAAIPAEILYRFLVFVETRLRKIGVRKIIVKNPPLHYAMKSGALLQTFLFNQGYTVTDATVGTIRYTHDDFSSGLNRLEQRKLKKSGNEKLHCDFLSHDNLEDVYFFIHKCRQEKEYPLSMTLADLQQTITRFPDRYALLGVYLNEEMVAASLSVRVTSSILYNFYADHAAVYDHLSPTVLLVKGLYEYCQQNAIDLLDLGTSAVNGQPNFGLLNFKMRLGGRPSPKLTFEKHLTP